MSIFPDRSEDQRTEEVLQRAPLVRTFLDVSAQNLNFERWSNEVALRTRNVIEDMTNYLGNDWYRLTLAPLLINAEITEVLNPDMSYELKLGLIRGALAMGFEVGNYDDLKLIKIDIIKGFAADRSFNPADMTDERSLLKAVHFMFTLL